MKLNFNTLFRKENKPAIEQIKEIKTPDDFREKMKWLRNAGYFTVGVAGTILTESEIAGAQDIDSIKNPEIFTSPAIDKLDSLRDYVVGKDSLPPINTEIEPETVDTVPKYSITSGDRTYTFPELIKLFPSLNNPKVWITNFPGIPFPGEKPKE